VLNIYKCQDGRLIPLDPPQAGAGVWFDLENPTPEELAFVTRETGLSLPEHDDITEIENSARLAANGPALTMTMPIVTRTEAGLQAADCGFVLAPDHLVTLRFAPSLVFTQFPTQPHDTAKDAAHVFALLLEAITDRLADALEKLRRDLDALSHQIFHHRFDGAKNDSKIRKRNVEAELQGILVTLGRDYDTISFLRDSQLGIARIAPYAEISAPWLPKPVAIKLQSVAKDVASLNEFSTHLTDKVQFLLDTTLGLINIAQNSLIKVLTVVSIVGIPPTLIAGIYGMNFQHMPEYAWTYGYEYVWALMFVSAITPLVIFRWKAWL
jgi:magnesium transporter